MKTFIRIIFLFIALCSSNINVEAISKTNRNSGSLAQTSFKSGNQVNQLVEGNYLIVGSFSLLRNAQSFTKKLNDQFLPAKLAFYQGTQFYYVYLFQSNDISIVRKERDKVRQRENFESAWILIIKGNGAAPTIDGSNLAAKVNTAAPVVAPETKEAGAVKINAVPNDDTNTNDILKSIAEDEKRGIKTFKVYSNVIASNTFKEIQGQIKVVYTNNNKLNSMIEAHRAQLVKLPKNESPEIQLICDVFGYKKVEQDLNLSNPVTDNTKSYVHKVNDTIVVDFELTRYKKGDLFTMFNVFFYTDAALMLPKSTYELNSLVDMVKENEKLKIAIHGHTNGNAFGRIVKLKDDDKNYFTPSSKNITTTGTAKELSYQRALVIKRYLVDQGIDENRIEVHGWGGKKMLYDSDSPESRKNVRVEVEITTE